MPTVPSPAVSRDQSFALPGPTSPFEARLVGACLVDAGARDDVLAAVVPGDLVDEGCRRALAAMVALEDEGVPVGAHTVAARLDLEGVGGGGRALVAALIAEAAPRSALGDMIASVRGCAAARVSAQVARLLGEQAEGSGGAPGAVAAAVARAQEVLAELTVDGGESDWVSAGEAVSELLTVGPVAPMCSTGMPDLDELLGGGLRAGQLVVVAARPAMGKSTFAFDLCRHAAVVEGVGAVYVSLEMSRRELSLRLLAAEGGVDMRWLQTADLTRLGGAEGQVVREAWQRAQGAPLEIVDPVDASWASISQHIRSAHRRVGGGPMIAVVDYLGLVALEGRGGEVSRQNGLQEVSRRCKQLAKALGIVVVLVSQLNRGPELRADHRPMMADLRETGSLEQDADIVVLLYRPDYYEPTERAGEADVIVAKQRNGQAGTVPMVFQGHYSRFRPMARL